MLPYVRMGNPCDAVLCRWRELAIQADLDSPELHDNNVSARRDEPPPFLAKTRMGDRVRKEDSQAAKAMPIVKDGSLHPFVPITSGLRASSPCFWNKAQLRS